jgi:hypothetical protein
MRHRHDSERGDRQLHPGETSSRLPHYAAQPDRDLCEGPASAIPTAADPERPDDNRSHGASAQADEGDFAHHQGRYGESQGRHAQSGHGRGGVEFSGHSHDSEPSRGIAPDRPVS